MSSLTKKTYSWLAAMLVTVSLAAADVKVGAPFPDLGEFGLEGSLPERAGKVVLVDFWATWCGPCKASFPAYTTLQRELAERGFTIIAVSVDKQKGQYDEFVKKFAPAFPTVRDAAQKMAAAVKVPGMPTSYLIDRQGVLRSVHTGFHGDGTARDLRDEIIKLLEEKS
jgi:thiol-disulfide isomerase/thioredoxin